jgi:hypothetical protein
MAAALPLLLAQKPAGPTPPKDTGNVNPEILELAMQDAWDRGTDMFTGKNVKPADGGVMIQNDEKRHVAVRKLMDEGKLQTGKDFEYAALIFQHSFTGQDLMLAHVFAMTAVAKGNVKGKWYVAATWDRYLQTIQQPQVFGTQFRSNSGGPLTQEPYDRTLLSDSIRASWCVVPLAKQEQILKDGLAGKRMDGTELLNCK